MELLHLGQREDFDPATNTVSCYLHVKDADALYAEWAAAGVGGDLVAPVRHRLRPAREFAHRPRWQRRALRVTDRRPPPEDGRQDPVPADDPLAVAATTAIQSGDLDGLSQLLEDHPRLGHGADR